MKRVTDMLDSLIERNNYRAIINHSGFEYKSSLPVIDTRKGNSATNHAALESLSTAVSEQIQVKNEVESR